MVRAASPRSADMRHVFTGDVIRSFTFMTHLRYRGPAGFRHDAESLTAVRRSSPQAALERRIAEKTCKLAAVEMAEWILRIVCVAAARAGRRRCPWLALPGRKTPAVAAARKILRVRSYPVQPLQRPAPRSSANDRCDSTTRHVTNHRRGHRAGDPVRRGVRWTAARVTDAAAGRGSTGDRLHPAGRGRPRTQGIGRRAGRRPQRGAAAVAE